MPAQLTTASGPRRIDRDTRGHVVGTWYARSSRRATPGECNDRVHCNHYEVRAQGRQDPVSGCNAFLTKARGPRRTIILCGSCRVPPTERRPGCGSRRGAPVPTRTSASGGWSGRVMKTGDMRNNDARADRGCRRRTIAAGWYHQIPTRQMRSGRGCLTRPIHQASRRRARGPHGSCAPAWRRG